ncbi:hypothetical protein GCM10023347_38570 [Streptomyces chumphonensis]
MATLGHADELPFPRGTLVHDACTGRTGQLMGVLVERADDGQVVSRQAYLRPVGGGREWEAPVVRIQAAVS